MKVDLIEIKNKSGLFLLCMFAYVQYCSVNGQSLACLTEAKREIVSGISYGNAVVKGVARVVKTLDDCTTIKSGDIVVAVMTKDEWIPAIKVCAGIITDLGDDTCHAVNCARQYGIPVIINARNATEKVRNGDAIMLDCSQQFKGCVYSITLDELPVQTPFINVSGEEKHCFADAYQTDNRQPNDYYGQRSMIYQDTKTVQNKVQQPTKQRKITQEFFNQHYPFFVKYVLDMQHDLNTGRKYEKTMFATARWWYKCDDFAIECIPVSYDFFDQSKQYLRSILNSIDLEFVNDLLERATIKPGDMNWLARVSHEEHIKRVALPPDVTKEDLIRHPARYKKIIDQKRVDAKQYHSCMGAALFTRYCTERRI